MRRALRPCAAPTCSALVESGYCARHAHRAYDQARGNSAERLYTWEWRRARDRFIEENYRAVLCGECKQGFRTKDGIDVDHIVPHRGDLTLFWDQANWQLLHKPCHSAKTARGQ